MHHRPSFSATCVSERRISNARSTVIIPSCQLLVARPTEIVTPFFRFIVRRVVSPEHVLRAKQSPHLLSAHSKHLSLRWCTRQIRYDCIDGVQATSAVDIHARSVTTCICRTSGCFSLTAKDRRGRLPVRYRDERHCATAACSEAADGKCVQTRAYTRGISEHSTSLAGSVEIVESA